MPRVLGRGFSAVVSGKQASSDDLLPLEDNSTGDATTPQGPEMEQQRAIFEQYMGAATDVLQDDCLEDQVFSRGLARVREHISSQGDSSCCLICLGGIKPADAIWHCSSGCYAVMHLMCAQEWARNQLDAAAAKAAAKLPPESTAAAVKAARAMADWGCPKCRQPYPQSGLPSTYYCFCGKAANPVWDPWIAPHTCGELCGKLLPGDCDHSCLLLCHPGPCPPCPRVVDAECYCGRCRVKRRCGHHEFSCSGRCGRRLECGHTCDKECHPGDCPSCPMVDDYKCACGAEQRRLTCGQRHFQCTRVCCKPLSCGRHLCEKVCHSGACGKCHFEGIRTCPCGKVTYTDLNCTEKAPSCGNTCGRLLPCGVHHCEERCHPGECTRNCRETVVRSCRCGKMQKQVKCGEELRCERRCGAMRPCGRHPCKRRCCDGDCPPCEDTCGRRLKCGNHKCPAPCHSEPCGPCPLSVTISCACGQTSVTVPCGAESRTPPPRCFHPCPVPPTCRHAGALSEHRCHFGSCPPCTAPCGEALACGHACSASSCHDPPVPAVAAFMPPPPPKAPAASAAAAAAAKCAAADSITNGKRQNGSHMLSASSEVAAGSNGGCSGAATSSSDAASNLKAVAPSAVAALQAREALAASPAGVISRCPACPVPVDVSCVGRHETVQQPCATAAPFTCTRACGEPLACGNHSCALSCHRCCTQHLELPPAVAAAAAQDPSQKLEARPCAACSMPCGRPRDCVHPCPLACHTSPCPACEVQCRCACHCGKTSLTLPCSALTAANAAACTATSILSNGVVGLAVSESSSSSLSVDPLCCGKPCHRQLPRCPHFCTDVCHSGPCRQASSCSEEVSVRCECRRLKAKWPCGKVQDALKQAGRGDGAYDGTTQLRLLPCDQECKAAASLAAAAPNGAAVTTVVESGASPASGTSADQAGVRRRKDNKAAAAASGGSGAGMVLSLLAQLPDWLPIKGTAIPSSAPTAASSSSSSSTVEAPRLKAMTRAERLALQAEKEAAALKKEKHQLWLKRRKMLLQYLVYTLVVILGVALGLRVRSMLRKVDSKLQERWAPV